MTNTQNKNEVNEYNSNRKTFDLALDTPYLK